MTASSDLVIENLLLTGGVQRLPNRVSDRGELLGTVGFTVISQRDNFVSRVSPRHYSKSPGIAHDPFDRAARRWWDR
jgi:hypothetical protein